MGEVGYLGEPSPALLSPDISIVKAWIKLVAHYGIQFEHGENLFKYNVFSE
jgi:hypothetical protein